MLAVFALFARVVGFTVIGAFVIAIGIWSPYWVSLAWLRVFDRRPNTPPRFLTRATTKAEERAFARQRLLRWLASVNRRF